MRYGFVIDHRKCIGCHACTVACKEENQVPLGVYRTWVKYIEKGAFPHTRRYFSVLRCNHCDDAPCVTICPTVALYRRPDGIVDFDGERCIGCKSCMQACPYDALYIDPGTQTAAKCHYCAHRVEVGLEPACVIVCPEQAIIAGDLDDPGSRIARLVATEQVQVRKPEQGTRPKVFYLGADGAALTPQALERGETYMFAEAGKGSSASPKPPAEPSVLKDLQVLARTVYDVPHLEQPWGWKIAGYLWTKSIAAGVLMVAGMGLLFGNVGGGLLSGVVAPGLALAFLALTMALLVLDLKRPDRFHYILLKPNWRSWLVLGTWVLIAYGAVAALWFAGGLTGNPALSRWLSAPGILLGAGAAGYSAFLFGQAEGRDFWQSPLLVWDLLAGALIAGAASLLLAGFVLGYPAADLDDLAVTLLLVLAAKTFLVLCEHLGSHSSQDVQRAARLLTRGALRGRFWSGAIVGGLLVPVLFLFYGGTLSSAVGAILALAGLWLYEDLWVRAGQSVPLS
jgi:Fe-S-cluster-containing dehydrogenase component/formate-dependent nitrite reductase membrane component NrfD